MKKLLMVIFIPVFTILGTPALIGAIMYDSSGSDVFAEIANDLYFEGADAEAMLMQEIDDSIIDIENGTTTNLEMNLHEDVINTAIFQAIREHNPDYMPTDGCVEDACNYIESESFEIEGFDISIRVVGMWVELEVATVDGEQVGRVILNTYIEVELKDGFTYKTVASVQFLVDDTSTEYSIDFEKVSLGNLPLPKSLFLSIKDIAAGQLDNVDLSADTINADLPIGSFDDDFKYTLLKDEILDEIDSGSGEADNGTAVAQEVLSIIFDEELLFFDFADEEWSLNAGVSKFRNDDDSDIPLYLYEMHDVDGNFDPTSFDAEAYLADKFTAFVFNSALAPADTGLVLGEELFNKLIYHQAGGFADTRTTTAYTIDGNEKEVTIGLNAMWFEIDPDGIDIKALFEISSIKSILSIRAENVTPVGETQQLTFEFSEINFGYDEGEEALEYLQIEDLDVFFDLFLEQGEMGIGTFNADYTFTITAQELTDTMSDGTNAGVVEVTGLDLVQDAIVIYMSPTSTELQDALDAFGDEIEAVIQSEEIITNLGDLLDTDNPGPEQDVYNSVVDLQDTLAAGEEVTAEDITVMFESFDDLDSETQEAFLQEFEDLFVDGDTIALFEGYFE